jgi:NADH-quinone oxidoreductase subunit H
VLIQSGTLSTRGIVEGQAWTGSFLHGLGQWYVRPAIVAFVIFLIAAIAETNHPPFDLVEAEQELVGGFHTEYTGIRFAIFFLAEFMNVITMSAIAVTLFLGGPAGPSLGFLDATSTINVWVMPVFWFMLKLLVLLYGTVLIRATLPRLRYDQLMDLGWKYMIEIAFLWLMVSGIVVIGRQEGWNLWIVVPAAAVGAVLVYLVLYASIAKPGELEQQDQIR